MRLRFKSSYAFVCLFFISLCSFAQDPLPSAYTAGAKVNYIRNWKPVYAETEENALTTRVFSDVSQSTSYFDGLGRPLQSVVKQGALATGSTAVDLVLPAAYDNVGRETFKYLPFSANSLAGATTTTDGAFKLNPFQQQSKFYNLQWANESIEINLGAGQGNFAYSRLSYEASPLSRIEKSTAPGKNWTGASRGISVKHWVNTTTDAVVWWKVTAGATGFFSTYAIAGTYPTSSLAKNITVDENGKQIVEFVDKEGHIILKKVQLTAATDQGSGSAHAGWLCTYYIYNELGQLSCVVQPRGVELMPLAVGAFDDALLLSEQCFRYEYDELGRMIIKQTPGAGTLMMVYDVKDRLVMTQDANLRAKNKWSVTLYDALNRPIQTGLLLNTFNNKTFADHLMAANGSAAYPFSAASPPLQWEWMTVIGYDDYSQLPTESNITGSLDNAYTATTYIQSNFNTAPEYAQPIVQSTLTRGMITWTKARLVNSWATFAPVYTVNIYDEEGQVIQQKANIAGYAMTVTTMQYSWDGKILRRIESCDRGVGEEITGTITRFQYDELGRVKQIDKKVASTLVAGGALPANWKPIAQYSYDALGQVIGKKLGLHPENSTAPLVKLDYSYNVRGWLLSINKQFTTGTEITDRYFGQELGYDKPVSLGNSIPQYNGNIASTFWKSEGDLQRRKYDFSYDGVNRLLTASFGQYVSGSGTGAVFNLSAGLDFSVSNLSYDGNGNLKTMSQRGWKPAGAFPIDELRYNYSDKSNKLKNVVDNQNDPNTAIGDFRANQAYLTTLGGTKTDAATDFEYDANGNMKKDRNKNIESIQYNHLNLPEKITFLIDGSPREVYYAYDAFRNKVIKFVSDPGQEMSKYTYYFGPIIYMKDSLSDNASTLRFINHEEGRIRYTAQTGPDPAKLDYDFFIKDHLGNIRSIVTEQIQEDAYQALAFEGTTAEVLSQDQQWDNKNGESINVAGVRQLWPSSFTATYGTSSGNGQYAMPVKKSTGAIGAAKLLKVMAGDKIHTAVDYYYNTANYNNSTAAGKNSLVNTIASVILNLTSPTGFVLKNGATQIANNLSNSQSVINFFASQGSGTTTDAKPKAYLNILFFDEQFAFDQTNSLAIPVTANSNTKATIDKTYANSVSVKKNGYVYLYVSNESETTVFFDNFLLGHERGRLLEESHYYPFGLTMEALTSRAMGKLENRYKFNDGSELENKEFSDGGGLDLYSTDFRSYDPQIGRFQQIDPLSEITEQLSPFSYANNNPILYNDPLGLSFAIPSQFRGAFFEGHLILPQNVNTTSLSNIGIDFGPGPSIPAKSSEGPKSTNQVQTKEKPAYKWYQYFNDHNPGGDFLYEVNKLNPLANFVNGVKTYATGSDSYGVQQSNTEATAQIATAFPIGRFGNAVSVVAKTSTRFLKFGGDEAVEHFGRHADQIIKVTGKSAYNLKNYVDDANWIIQNGTYSSKLNGYYHFMANGSKGQSLFGFVGMKNGGSTISTFHIKSATQLGLK